MTTHSIGTISENFSIADVYEVHFAADDLPQSIFGRRSQYAELIFDRDSGFQDNWKGQSSITPSGDGYDLVLQRRAYSAAGLALFYSDGVGGGGGSGNATSIQGEPVPVPSVGVLAFDGTDLTWTTPAGGGDVVGPSSAISDRVATFDGTTGKLIKDGGKTIASIESSAVATANTYTNAAVAALPTGGGWQTALDLNFTQMVNQTIVDGPVVIGGKTFIARNLTSGADSCAIVNGTGLRIDCSTTASLSYMPNGFDDGPSLENNLADLIPGFDPGSTLVRISMDMDSNSSALVEYIFYGIQRTTFPTTSSRAYNMLLCKMVDSTADLGSNGAVRRTFQGQVGAGRTYLEMPVANELSQLLWELNGQKIYTGDDTFSNTDPNSVVFAPANFSLVGRRQESDGYPNSSFAGQNSTGTSYHGLTVAMNDTAWPFLTGSQRGYKLVLGCFPYNTLGNLVAVFKRLRVEYKL